MGAKDSKSLEFHPIASIFPLLAGEELESLAHDIRQNGLRHAITLFEGKILDGRNRQTACKLAGKEPSYVEFKGSYFDAINFVWSENEKRRHQDSGSRAISLVKKEEHCEIHRKQVESLKSAATQRKKAGVKTDLTQSIGEGSRHDRETDGIVAKSSGTNRQYLADARKLVKEHPEEAERVFNHEKTITQVKRELKEQDRAQRRESNASIIATAPTILEALATAKFSTIVVDPPWDWGDEGDVDQLGRARPTYTTMSLVDLMAFPIAERADTDCHLYLWITNRSLPKGFMLLEQWDFRYVTCLTWCKPSIGMGNYFRGSTEHVLFGVRGSQQLRRKDIGTWFSAPRGDDHSQKPESFYDLVETCSPGPYLDVFARRERPCWTCWGGEL